MKLYKHQQNIINDNLKQTGLFLGTGSAKTRTALFLAQRSTLVVAPKIQVVDRTWEREVEKIGRKIDITVISKETFRRDWKKLPQFNTVIFDEAHTLCGVSRSFRYQNRQRVPKTSQLFEAASSYLKLRPPVRFYPLTATPARNPMAVWALGIMLGKKWDFSAFRDVFYFRIPMPGREVWTAKKSNEYKEKLAKVVKSLGYVGRLQDYFDVPEQTFKYIHCPLSDEQIKAIKELPMRFPDPLVLIGKTHQVENGFLIEDPSILPKVFKSSKFDALDDLLEEYDKILVFARYTVQIEQIEAYLSDHKIEVFVLNGKTKDRDLIIQKAEKSGRCVFIAQSQISTGYELPSFRCTIFMSASYSTVDNTQAQGRVLRANALHKNLYVYLHSGEIDNAVIACLKNHEDFSEILYAKKRGSIPDQI